MTLNSLIQRIASNGVMPANYTYFSSEFEHFSNLSQTNTEVHETLLELCNELESPKGRVETMTTAPKKSILDPSYKRVGGHKTTSTSAKVNHTSVPPRTRMIDKYQVDELHRAKKPVRRRQCHTCPVCRLEGHHARTCHNVLLEENTERANTFFKHLVKSNMVDSYVSSLAKRESNAFVQKAILRIGAVSKEAKQQNAQTLGASNEP